MDGFWLNRTIEEWRGKIPGIISSFDNQITDAQRVLNNATSGRVGHGQVANQIPDMLRAKINKLTSQRDSWQITINNRINTLVSTAHQTDIAVVQLVKDSQNAFFNSYSWLRPETQGSSFWDGWNKFWGGVGDALSGAWNSVVNWYNEHPIISRIIIGVAAVTVGLVITVLTGGAALPFLIGAGVMLAASSAIGAVIGGLTGGVDGMIQGAADGFMFGGLAALSGAVIGLTSLTGAAATIANGTLAGGLGGALSGGLSTGTFEGFATGLLVGVATGAVLSGICYGISKGLQSLKLKLVGNANPNRGPVEFSPPKNNPTNEQIAQTKAYVKGCNEALKDGALSPTGRVSTKGQLSAQASKAARIERTTAAASGNPYKGQAGHVPDTTWTGNPNPHSWLDLNPSVNTSLGAQALKYPIGYQPTKFVFISPSTHGLKSTFNWNAIFGPNIGNLLRDIFEK